MDDLSKCKLTPTGLASFQARKAKQSRQRCKLAAMVPLEAPLESLFETAHRASDDEGWVVETFAGKPPFGCEDLVFARREAEAGKGRQLRAQWHDTRAFETLCCPEVLFHPQVGVLYEGVEDCGIERLIAPGDAEVWEQFPVDTELATLNTILLGDVGDMFRSTWGRSSSKDSPSEMRRYRQSVRRDFPVQGDCTLVHTPRHPETGELLFEWGDVRAFVVHIRPSGEQGRCVVTALQELSPVPNWTPTSLTSKFIDSHWRECCEAFRTLTRYFENAAVGSIRSDSSYVIASLQKCCRGGPLLPIETRISQPALGEWEQFNIKNQHVSLYFNEFLRRIGVHEPIFFDSLHGMRLVHFQAAVQRGAWERVKSAFEEKFCEQRSAFRRFLGGRIAPEVRLGAEPRFLTPPSVDAGLSAGSPSSDEPPPRGPSIELTPVRFTFVHFHNDAVQKGTARARSESQ